MFRIHYLMFIAALWQLPMALVAQEPLMENPKVQARIIDQIINQKKIDKDRMDRMLGKPLPAFIYEDINGQLVDTKALLGKPALIYLWHLNYQESIDQIENFNALTEKLKGQVNFISMFFDEKELASKYLNQYPFAFKHIPSAGLYLDQFGQLPKIILVDMDGIVSDIFGNIREPETPANPWKLLEGIEDISKEKLLILLESLCKDG